MEVCGPAVEAFCCWGAVDAAWTIVLNSPDVSSVSKLVRLFFTSFASSTPARPHLQRRGARPSPPYPPVL
eukprot:1180036-Prorocentrum_minimum.AAC.2